MSAAGPVGKVLKQKAPARCETLEEVRAAVDELDSVILELLALRVGACPAAARFKLDAGRPVNDPERFRFQIERAVSLGKEKGLPESISRPVWMAMIEAFVAFEHVEYEKLKSVRA